MPVSKLLYRLALESTTQPLSQPVPGEDPAGFVSLIGANKLAWRTIRRRLVLHASGQHASKRQALPAGARRLLWVYDGEWQIGDALMDLSARSLLRDQGLEVDLLTSPGIAGLLRNDPWFGQVASTAEALQGRRYDCAVVLANKHRQLGLKRRHYRALPWVSLQEYFTGPNYHRGKLAARRLADLMGLPLSDADLEAHGRQKLGPVEPLPASLRDAPLAGALAVGMGGVHPERIYGHWPQVVRALADAGLRRFVLVGSDNGIAQAQGVVAAVGGQAEVLDLTGRLSLHETRSVLAATRALACVDGGLMHLALTTSVPVAALFTRGIRAAWRLPANQVPRALQAPIESVSALAPGLVADHIIKTLKDCA